MAARQTAANARAAVDWLKVKAILDPKDFAVVNQYRQRHMELTRVLAQPIPKVDGEQYRQQLMANRQVVADVEAALKQFKPREADVAPVLADLDEQEQEAVLGGD